MPKPNSSLILPVALLAPFVAVALAFASLAILFALFGQPRHGDAFPELSLGLAPLPSGTTTSPTSKAFSPMAQRCYMTPTVAVAKLVAMCEIYGEQL